MCSKGGLDYILSQQSCDAGRRGDASPQREGILATGRRHEPDGRRRDTPDRLIIGNDKRPATMFFFWEKIKWNHSGKTTYC